MKRHLTEWEKITANHISNKGLVAKTRQQQQQQKTLNNLIKEMGKGLEQKFPPQKYTRGH